MVALVSVRGTEDAAEVDREALGAGVAAYGQVLNTWGAILNSPGLFATYLPFLRQVNAAGELDQRVKDLVAVRVAVLNRCRYTTSHRVTAALGNGSSHAELVAVATGQDELLDVRLQAALALATAMTSEMPRVPASVERTGVGAPIRERAQRLFSEQELVELTMGISVWNALSRFHRVMDFDLDMPAAPPEIATLL